MLNISSVADAARVLDALGEQLARAGARYELVVIGGSALLALGLVSRATRDVDLVAGLPEGFLSRTERREHGPALVAWYASRHDQIHFKLYATVDQGPGKHEADLRALAPTPRELLTAARWTRTHDPSEGYRMVLEQVLAAFGVDDAALGA
jgi:Nucleotidyltransferase of unknown function (DUF6036)